MHTMQVTGLRNVRVNSRCPYLLIHLARSQIIYIGIYVCFPHLDSKPLESRDS